jgi:hypothetical protein
MHRQIFQFHKTGSEGGNESMLGQQRPSSPFAARLAMRRFTWGRQRLPRTRIGQISMIVARLSEPHFRDTECGATLKGAHNPNVAPQQA